MREGTLPKFGRHHAHTLLGALIFWGLMSSLAQRLKASGNLPLLSFENIVKVFVY